MIGAIRQVVIEAEAVGSQTALRLEAWARRHGIEVTVETGRESAGASAAHVAPDVGVPLSKRVIRVARHRGAALKPCTGRTDSLLCCNLGVVTQTVGCPLDCSYCILQSYQNRSQIVIRGDPEQILDQIEQELAGQPRRLRRICTGQVADSLALEPEVGFAAEAVRRFAGFGSGVLELKTKTDRVGFLLGLEHGGRTIVSWSLNPEEMVTAEERGAASVEARIEAAAEVVAAGYLTAFHLDPMVTADADPRPFCQLVERLFDIVEPGRVAYISMGTVRFQPAMRRTVSARFPASRIVHGELLPDVDGKLRLLSPQRAALYRGVARDVQRRCPEAFLYLCMEPARIWRRALGVGYVSRGEVELAMAQSLHRRFGLAPCPPVARDYPEP
jgi:spore photoproduct lyase